MSKENNRIYGIAIGVIMTISVIIAIIMCNLKQGYYLDEYYTYTLANGTHLGVAIDDGEWNDTGSFKQEIIVSSDDVFNFKQAAANTASDVHPPLYYFCVNFISSLHPDIYSKWNAWAVNIIALLACEVLIYKIMMLISKGDRVVTLLALVAYILNPAVISNIIYFRMYFLLSAIISGFAFVHLKMLDDDIVNWKRLFTIYMLGLTGFLTHYHMLFAMFVMAALFCIYMFFYKKNYKWTVMYAVTIILVIISEYLLWPMCIAHMFIGYRGKESMESLTNVSGIVPRLCTFFKIMNSSVFGSSLLFIIVALVVLKIALFVRNKKKNVDFMVILSKNSPFVFLGLSCVGYFMAIALTAIQSNRFLFPIEGILLSVVIYSVYASMTKINNEKYIITKYIPELATVIVVSIVTLCGGLFNRIDYIYPEREIINEAVLNDPNACAIVFQGEFYDALIDYYPEYNKIYFCGENVPKEKAKSDLEDYLNNTDDVIIFVENVRDIDSIRDFLLNDFEHNTELEYIGNSNGNYDVYILN